MKMSDKTGGAAFPEAGLSGLPNGEFIHGRSGMTLLDYFAGQALLGILSSSSLPTDSTFEGYSKCAYEHATCMLAERTRRMKKDEQNGQ